MSHLRSRQRSTVSSPLVASTSTPKSMKYAEELVQKYFDGGWAPPYRSIVMGILSMRLVSGMLNAITDCDEAFNYWEPTHYLMHGSGFQTWEYRFGIAWHCDPIPLCGSI
eukprot:TRINITY_DN1309_c0_g2_i7.p2 TRINITY_DN1309_c0_g2~~TRINITY_DN1309_c0_g2_i7.p2  ORF type:complete len:110 (-),score=13.32 TRINITY_DN1309_c0_g2_i7:820-1149(-)